VSTAPFAGLYPAGYNQRVIEIRQTTRYRRWVEQLRDHEVRSRILAMVRRLSLGNPGDVGAVGEGVSESRIDCGPGYRVYYRQTGTTLAVLLIGSTKRTQSRDIERAIALARELTGDDE
jgi:putative addiction module killer protein